MSKKRVYKVLALFMAVVMTVTSFHVGEFRAKAGNNGNTESTGESKPKLSKKAEMLEDGETPGQTDYEITLGIGGDGKETVIKADPIDLIFVLDTSNSMLEDMNGTKLDRDRWDNIREWDKTRWSVLQKNLTAMLDSVFKVSNESKVSIVAYGGSNYLHSDDYALLSYNGNVIFGKDAFDNGTLKSLYTYDNSTFYKIRELADGNINYYSYMAGGTNCKAGFIGALDALSKYEGGHKKYVVFMSDGVPTDYSVYDGEYDDRGNYKSAYTYNIGNITGKEAVYNDNVLDAKYIDKTVDVAKRVGNQNNVNIFTVGIGKNMETESKYLLNPNGGRNYGQIYKNATDDKAMENAFDAILADIVENTKVHANVVSDPLTDYVELYEDMDMVLRDGEKEIVLNEKTEAGNEITYTNKKEKSYKVVYNTETRTITWSINKELGVTDAMALSYRVHTTDEVDCNYTDEDYSNDSKCQTGEEKTGTFAGKRGYPSNGDAKLSYTYKDDKNVEHTPNPASFPQPVVRNYVPCALTVTKEIGGDYTNIVDASSEYKFEVSLKSDALDIEELRSKLSGTKEFEIKKDNKEWTLQFGLQANESITINNIPGGTKYNVTENMENSASKYYECKNSWEVNGTPGKASGVVKAEQNESNKTDFAYYTMTDENGNTEFFDNNNQPVTGDLLKKIQRNHGRKDSVEKGLFKQENGVWVSIDQTEDKVTASSHYNNDGYYYVNANDPIMRTLSPFTMIELQDGTKRVVGGNKISIVDNASNYYLVKKDNEYRLAEKKQIGDVEKKTFLGWGTEKTTYGYFDIEDKETELCRCVATVTIKWFGLVADRSDPKYSPQEPDQAKEEWSFIEEKSHRRYFKTASTCDIYSCNLFEGEKNASDTIAALKNYAAGEGYQYEISGPTGANKVIIFKAWGTRYNSFEAYCKAVFGYENMTKTTYHKVIKDLAVQSVVNVKCINNFTPKKTKLTINKNLVSADNLDDNVFIFKIENTDKDSPGYRSVVYKAIAFTKGNTSESVTIDDLYLAFKTGYKITEVSHMRYDADKNEKNIALETTKGGAVTFTNKKVKESEFSGSACVVNHGELQDGIIHFSNNNKTSLVSMRILAFGVTKVISTCAKMLARAIR